MIGNGKNKKEKKRKKAKKKGKHVPQRTCIGCRETLSKKELIRLVRTPDGIKLDLTGKLNGRGAYIHNAPDCWERAFRGALENALKTKISIEEENYLRHDLNKLVQK